MKETVLSSSANLVTFILPPIASFLLALFFRLVTPIEEDLLYFDVDVDTLYELAKSFSDVNGMVTSGC